MANKKKVSKKTTTSKKKTTKKTTGKKKVVSNVKRRTNNKGNATNKKNTTTKNKNTISKKEKVVSTIKKVKVEKGNKKIEEKPIKVLKNDIEKHFDKTDTYENKKFDKGKLVNIKEYLKNSIREILNKKFILYFIIFVLILMVFFGILVRERNNKTKDIKFESINLNKYLNLYKENSDLTYVYITDNTCIKCNEYEVNLKKIENDFKIEIKKLDISNFNEKELKEVEDSNSFIVDIKNMPILVSIKDKESISAINGIKEYSAVKNFINYSNNPNNKSFEKISIDRYLSLLKSRESLLIYIGTSSDSSCEKFSATLEKVSSSKGIKVYYLNTDEIVTDENITKLNESSEIFNEQWFVPTILIIKNSKIKDYRMYAMNEEELIKFLDRNKM